MTTVPKTYSDVLEVCANKNIERLTGGHILNAAIQHGGIYLRLRTFDDIRKGTVALYISNAFNLRDHIIIQLNKLIMPETVEVSLRLSFSFNICFICCSFVFF